HGHQVGIRQRRSARQTIKPIKPAAELTNDPGIAHAVECGPVDSRLHSLRHAHHAAMLAKQGLRLGELRTYGSGAANGHVQYELLILIYICGGIMYGPPDSVNFACE